MSIEEFLDGMPILDEHSFSQFYPSSYITKRVPVYITTTDTPSEQVSVIDNDQSNLLHRRFHKKWDVKMEDKKRESNEMGEESSSSSRKRSRI